MIRIPALILVGLAPVAVQAAPLFQIDMTDQAADVATAGAAIIAFLILVFGVVLVVEMFQAPAKKKRRYVPYRRVKKARS